MKSSCVFCFLLDSPPQDPNSILKTHGGIESRQESARATFSLVSIMPSTKNSDAVEQEGLPPHVRRIQVYTLDPAVDASFESAGISRSVLHLPWEEQLLPGPVGEYLEVVDIDPSSGLCYEPVDLNLYQATDGLTPSTTSAKFHQQMVYAVAMLTITNFERAIGRKVMWSPRPLRVPAQQGRSQKIALKRLDWKDRFVKRLRIYPHALREENAYYSSQKKALLFGYYQAPTSDPRDELPGGYVFTALSHDIIAHETTHAILDGIHPELVESGTTDALAFHEAFADIVAIFQHFTLPGLLLDQIQRHRGDLDNDSLLVRLATQFARSTGRGTALRNALGNVDDEGNRLPPDPQRFQQTDEPHERGSILVAAVYDAFHQIYQDRVADLKRIATGGTGVLPQGHILSDLAKRFADEAIRAADRVLTICIRAIDYLPPVDITLGDYLRALVTADYDAYPEDRKRYRLAFIDSFRNHGIYPLDVPSLSEDGLLWRQPNQAARNIACQLLPSRNTLRTMAATYRSHYELGKSDYIKLYSRLSSHPRSQKSNGVGDLQKQLEKGDAESFKEVEDEFQRIVLHLEHSKTWAYSQRPDDTSQSDKDPDYQTDTHGRELNFMAEQVFSRFLYIWLMNKGIFLWPKEQESEESAEQKDTITKQQVQEYYGLQIESLEKYVEYIKYKRGPSGDDQKNSFESRPKDEGRLIVNCVRPILRPNTDGDREIQLLVILTQTDYHPLYEHLKEEESAKKDLEFPMRGGCTLIIDPLEGEVKYSIFKRLGSPARIRRVRRDLQEQVDDLGVKLAIDRGLIVRKSTPSAITPTREPFAIAHSEQRGQAGY